MSNAPPKIGKWISTKHHFPPVGVMVLGYWGGMDMEAVQCMCRGDGKQEHDWWWETRSGDTAEPQAWAEIDWSLMHLAGADK